MIDNVTEKKIIRIAILAYPGSTKSASYGLQEMFDVANQASEEQQLNFQFVSNILDLTDLKLNTQKSYFDAVILPPASNSEFYLNPSAACLHWLNALYQQGTIMTSACAGVFILAKAALITNQTITTHWRLSAEFETLFPMLCTEIDKIIINEGSLITAGGMMAWVDLGLELIAQLSHPSIMRQVGKLLVIDTGLREQRYYQQFIPTLNHSDQVILKLQQDLQQSINQQITVAELSRRCHLTTRTFLRRFKKATGVNPTEYIQRSRIQKACNLLETTSNSFEFITTQVGYEDVSACRKVFIRIMGLTPSAFRQRFSNK